MKIKNLATILGFGVLGFNNLQGQNHSLEPIIFNSKYHSEHTNAIEQYEPYNRQEISLDSNFNILNAGLKEYLNKIYLVDQKDFFDSAVVGHAHPYGGIICLTEYFTNEELFHEAGHVRHLALNEINSDFSKKWEKIANFEYRVNNSYKLKDELRPFIFPDVFPQNVPTWEDGTTGPNYGCLSSFSKEFFQEDIADFVGCLGYEETPESLKKIIFRKDKEEKNKSIFDILPLHLKLEIVPAYFSLYFADTTDHRYKQKLDLLKEYNFFTKEEHEKLSKDLGSLRYLLKKEE